MKHFRYYVRLLFLLFSVNGITKIVDVVLWDLERNL